MIFTVITPAMNCADLLERNFQSVESQGFGDHDLEQWVIDGGSDDGTKDLLKRNARIKWVSEPDRGLSHAVNKGLSRSEGEWIIWLNADDELADGALSDFIDFQRHHKDTKMFSGDLAYMDYEGRMRGVVSGREYTFEELTEKRFDINQPSMVVHRDVYDTVGDLDESFKFAMDYEWTVRAVREYSCIHIPKVMAKYHMRSGSLMDANMAAHYRAFARVRRKYGLSRLSYADCRIAIYILTDSLRRIPVLRRSIRRIKAFCGYKVPIHGKES